MRKTLQVLLSALLLFVSFLGFGDTQLSFAADSTTPSPTISPTPTPTSSNSASSVSWPQPCQDKGVTGQACVDLLAGTLTSLKGQEQTLSSQIAVMDNQIQLTQARIYSTQQQINDLTLNIDTATQKVNNIQSSLNNLTQILMNRVAATYEVGTIQPMQILLTSGTVGDFLQRLNYLKIAQAHDKKLLYDTVQAKNDYQNQKDIYETEKKQVLALQDQLKSYTDELNQEEGAKKQLLAQTQGSESNYNQLLQQAKEQLAALSNFATARSGSGGSIIPHQDESDGWGKYYNQRDANWGNLIINNSGYQVWQVGCLLTSYAMVSSHFGSTVTPADVASNPSDFWAGTAEFNLPGPAPAGHSVDYVRNPSLSDLQNDLNNGAIVIAGLSADGGPSPAHYSDHWVVLRSVEGSDFHINDPWYSDGMNSLLSTHYSGWTIIEARVYH